MSPAAIGRRTFAALANPNYRRWYAGQGVSLIGTWMQTIAQGWLVYTLSGSGTELGLVVALQMVPVLILAPYAGVIADRVDKRRLIIARAGRDGACSRSILGLLTVTGVVRLWEVFVLAAALGVATAFDNPTRQAFVMELVGPGSRAQRGHAQLRARERGARGRARRGRHPDRHRRRLGLLPRQRRQLPRRDRLAAAARPLGAAPEHSRRRAAAGSCARACATSRARPRWPCRSR